jgi:flagellar motor switch protein FliM
MGMNSPSSPSNSASVERIELSALSRICTQDTEGLRPLLAECADALGAAIAAVTGLRATVTATVISASLWQEDIASLEEPTCAAAFLDHQEGAAILSLSRDLAHRLVEESLGSRTSGPTPAGRELTSVDRVLLAPFFDTFSDRLSTTFHKDQERLSSAGILTRRTELPGQTSGEPTVSALLEVSIEERRLTAGLALVTRLVKRRAEPTPALPATPEQKLRTLRILSRSGVTFEAQLQGPTIRMSDLAELRQGDVLTFSVPAENPITGVCNGLTAYRGDVLEKGRRNQRVFRVRSALSGVEQTRS